MPQSAFLKLLWHAQRGAFCVLQAAAAGHGWWPAGLADALHGLTRLSLGRCSIKVRAEMQNCRFAFAPHLPHLSPPAPDYCHAVLPEQCLAVQALPVELSRLDALRELHLPHNMLGGGELLSFGSLVQQVQQQNWVDSATTGGDLPECAATAALPHNLLGSLVQCKRGASRREAPTTRIAPNAQCQAYGLAAAQMSARPQCLRCPSCWRSTSHSTGAYPNCFYDLFLRPSALLTVIQTLFLTHLFSHLQSS